VLDLVIGGVVGLTVVGVHFADGKFRASRLSGGAVRVAPIFCAGDRVAAMGYLLYKYFPDARGSGVPQTKAALYARGGVISLGHGAGKFFCTSATLAERIPLGREGPSVQVGAGLSSCWDAAGG